MKQIVVNGLLTNYEQIGSSDNPYLLILPGWMCKSSSWMQVAKNMSGKFNVLILDFPGFGATRKPDAAWDTFDYANFVEKFLLKLEVAKCDVIAHSFGGRVATILAANASLINRLILVDAAGYEKKDLMTKIKLFVSRKIKKLFKHGLADFFKNKIGSNDYKMSQDMRSIFVKLVNQDLSGLMPKIKAQTLIIWGEFDDVLNVNRAKIMKKLIPNSVLRIVWGAKHFPHLEKPKELLKIIKEFL